MVIQRIQSLYLLLASIFMGLFSYLPTVNFKSTACDFNLSPFSIEAFNFADTSSISTELGTNFAEHTMLYFLIGVLIAVLIFISIFLFKKLKLQKRIVSFTLFLFICYTLSLLFYCYIGYQNLNVTEWSFTIASFFPILILIFLVLAIRGINKDRKLLSDSSRIR